MQLSKSLPRAGRCVAALAILFSVSQTIGQSVLIDFGNDDSFRGLSVDSPDTNGNTWNSLRTGLFYTDLLDTGGAPTTIDFGFSTAVATDSFNGPAGATDSSSIFPFTLQEYADLNTDIDAPALGDLGVINAAFDAVITPNPTPGSAGDIGDSTPVRFEIQQLDPGSTYDLTFFASHKFEGDLNTVFNVYTDNTYTTLVDTASLQIRDELDASAHNRDEVVTISEISPQEFDILYVEFIGENNNNGYLNAMQIVGTPSANFPGDANGDGVVDLLDLDILGTNFGLSPADFSQGDFNGDNVVDLLDLDILGTNFGSMAGSSIPEPGSLALLCLAGMLAARRR